MYPMNPASGEYVFGFPLIENATVLLPNKKQLQIQVNKLTQKRKEGIASIQFNGRQIPVNSIKHKHLMQGGKIVFQVYK